MTRTIQFTKMHGAGNDYIYINAIKYPIADPEKRAVEWSAYHTGIGSDGLVLIDTSDKADFSMRIFNADGSEAMMCGNASRCIGKYLFEYGLTTKTTITLDTLSGIKLLKLQVEDGKVATLTVDMSEPQDTGTIDFRDKLPYVSTTVSMGNPHLITFVENIDEIDLPEIGPKLENDPLFPDRTNVEFAQVLDKNRIRMRVWERGSGITQACGTGACASVVAGILKGCLNNSVEVELLGGSVRIDWDGDKVHTGRDVFLTGPAEYVFTAEL